MQGRHNRPQHSPLRPTITSPHSGFLKPSAAPPFHPSAVEGPSGAPGWQPAGRTPLPTHPALGWSWQPQHLWTGTRPSVSLVYLGAGFSGVAASSMEASTGVGLREEAPSWAGGKPQAPFDPSPSPSTHPWGASKCSLSQRLWPSLAYITAWMLEPLKPGSSHRFKCWLGH